MLLAHVFHERNDRDLSLVSVYSQTTRSVPISSFKLIWNFPNYFCNFEKPLCKSPEESCKSPYEICNVPKLIKCF